MPLLDLLEREPALLHEVDEPEVAGSENDDVPISDVVLRPLPAGRPLRCLKVAP